jgi:hypothetical protein
VSAAITASVALLLVQGSADAQVQNSDQQKCINALNKDAQKLAATQGKEISSCIKNASKGKEANPQACLTADSKGKVAGGEAKTLADETKNCTIPPDFARARGIVMNAFSVGEELALAEDVFGPDLNGVISTETIGGCQAAVSKAYEKLAATITKEFTTCKKNVLKAGTSDRDDIAACVGADPKGTISGAAGKLADAVSGKCSDVDSSVAFPGSCSDLTGSPLAACIEDRVRCRMCEMLNAEGLGVDCDVFDDGQSNGSCEISFATCTLAPGSELEINTPLGVPIPLPLTGSFRVGLPVDGAASCEVAGVDPFVFPGTGAVCITPISGCPAGPSFCSGGSGVGINVDVTGDANIASCGNEEECETSCLSFCGNLGARKDPATTTCDEGLCRCVCVDDTAGNSVPSGGFQCSIGVSTVIEDALPCDGADINNTIGAQCVTETTGTASVVVSTIDDTNSGNPISCASIESGATTGLSIVGQAVAFDNPDLGGDLGVAFTAVCQ